VLHAVLGDASGSSITIAWAPVDGADGYVVWLSEDGRRFAREEARWVTGTRFVAGGLSEGGDAFVRVSAVAGEIESAPSDALAASVAREGARVLLVDANDRWEREPSPENTLGGAHDFLVPHAEVLAPLGLTFDSVANEAVARGEIELTAYSLVVWASGEESVDDETFDADERAAIGAFSASGGALVVSGAEIGFDLAGSGTADETEFMERTLGASYVADDAGTVLATGVGPLASIGDVVFYAPATVVVAYPDVLAPTTGAQAVLAYVGGTGGTAAVLRTGIEPVVVLGFPLEAIEGTRERAAIVSGALRELGVVRRGSP
jgi:hypothetical protein